jgi:membrane protein DedA with SNARE-associated domain
VSSHIEIARVLSFVERHGYGLLFGWVLVEQSAIPVPSAPLLLATGALIHTGGLTLLPALLSCLAAALVADTVWFELGRHRGRQVLRLVCRLSLEPDSCVRQTENAFRKYGMRSLLVSKFIPGLNAVAAPLAGNSRSSYLQFAIYDVAGSSIWAGAYFAAGYVFSGQLELAVDYASRMGSNLLALVVLLFVLWIAGKYLQRRRFLRQLEIARIAPVELQQRLAAGEDLFIVDLRNGPEDEAVLIPGAVRILPEDLATAGRAIPRDRDIILFCS